MRNRGMKFFLFMVYVLPLPLIIFSLATGPSELMGMTDAVLYLFRSPWLSEIQNPVFDTILFDVRLPRVLLAFLAGGALAVSGSSLQAIFRNPLVSPYILGLSSGAAFGAALSLAFLIIPVGISAFIFGLIATMMSYFASMRRGEVSVVGLILAGVVVGGIFTALLTVVQFISDPFRLQTIVHWTMGNLHNATMSSLKSVYIPVGVSMIVLYMMRWKMNILALGDVEATTSGIHPKRSKLIILIAATIATSAVVSVSGIIGMFGLMVPHMTRMICGADNRVLIPVNFLFGGIFLLVIDNFSRTLTSFEIPIGIFTMLLGAPFFVYLMKKTSIGWE
jgi:iron complex transport system permease protein